MTHWTLTDNQKDHAIELLTRQLVAYHGGGPYGCLATVRSRTDDSKRYEVEIVVRDGKADGRCECDYWLHAPSRTCSHLAAVFLVWRADQKGDEGNAMPEANREMAT